MMTDPMRKTLDSVANAARKHVRQEAKANFESYFSDRNPHLKYLGISNPDNLNQAELIKELEEIRAVERNNTKYNAFDRHRYLIVSTALMVEKERQSKAMDITTQDFKQFLESIINEND